MKTLLYPVLIATTLAAGACAKTADTADTAAPPAAAASTDATAAPTAASTDATAGDASTSADSMAGMSAQEHAAMDAANHAHAAGDAATSGAAMASSVQAGWYTAGSFRACGSAQAMKVDKAAEIDAQIKKGGMASGEPVYVQLEGMPMGDAYMLTRVAQVGSKTPVRDCPMTGTTTQTGG